MAIDFIMLVIAIQTVLYVFRRYSNPEFGGLYEYRWIIYALYIVVPATIASLAFVNRQNGYISVGSFCYLPADPIWYRIALAWIPRSCVFLATVIIQITIYIYIVRTMDQTANTLKEIQSSSATGETLVGSLEDESSFRKSVEVTVKTASEMMHQTTPPNMRDQRHEIKRQARLLFVYPMAYLVMWIFPLIAQILAFMKDYHDGVPFWVSLVWGFFLAAQAGIDASIFLLRERPWSQDMNPLPTWAAKIGSRIRYLSWSRKP
jgi:G protein-coupled receptor GPR1